MAIHPTAIVDKRAEIASDVEIGPFCVIDGNVRIGASCRVYQGVYLTGWTQIGEGCELHPHVIVGHTPQDTKFTTQRSYCRVGDRTILRENVTIHRGTIPESSTEVGSDCFLLGGSHVAHNCTLGDRVTLINNVLLAGHVEVGGGAIIGGGAGVHQFVRIGELAIVTGNARVSMDVVPFALTDEDGRIAGLNRIGLRRAGIDQKEIQEIREAYRMLFSHGRDFSTTVEEIVASMSTSSGRCLAEFLKQKSKRNLAGRSRRRRQET